MSNKTTFKAYLHDGGGEMITIIVKDNLESINDAVVTQSYLWNAANGHKGYEVDDDVEISLETALKKFSHLESFDMTNDFERILKEAREYAAEPENPPRFEVKKKVTYYVLDNELNSEHHSFETEGEAVEEAAALEFAAKVVQLQDLVDKKFPLQTCKTFLKAFEKLQK